MTETVSMKLVFRVGGVGFSLPIDDLVEIQEGLGASESPVAESPVSQVGVLPFRGGTLPVFDLRPVLGLPLEPSGAEWPTVLVLCGREGMWGGVVDRVEGIFADSNFSFRPLPPLLQRQVPLPYDGLWLWREEPLHACSALALETMRGAT